MNNSQRILTINFAIPIAFLELSFFRGAVLSLVRGSEHSLLFHNHVGDGYRYSYPLIQYKRIGGKAAIVCVGDGADSIGEFFSSLSSDLHIGNRVVPVRIENVKASRCLVQVWEKEFRYVVRKWLPLSSENYREYKAIEGLPEKMSFLQRMMVGNVLSMGKGLGVQFEKEVKCEIEEILGTSPYVYKGVKMLGFDVGFRTNVSLPDYFGLGKGVSLGYGMVKKINN